MKYAIQVEKSALVIQKYFRGWQVGGLEGGKGEGGDEGREEGGRKELETTVCTHVHMSLQMSSPPSLLPSPHHRSGNSCRKGSISCMWRSLWWSYKSISEGGRYATIL